jgi:hypothetical protein
LANTTITVTDLAYQPDADSGGGTLTVVVTLPPPAPSPHGISIPRSAIPERMARYGLATPRAALHAILCEHAQRLCRLAPQPAASDPYGQGGLRTDVDAHVPAAHLSTFDTALQ